MTISFKPVRDVPERMDILKRFLSVKNQASLLAEIEQGTTKCRLVWEKATQQYVGVFAYQKSSRQFEVSLFSGIKTGSFTGADLTVEEIVALAKENEASEVSVALLKTEQWAIDLFRKSDFQWTKTTDKQTFLHLELARKRRREPEAVVEVSKAPRQIAPLSVTLRHPYVQQIQQGLKTIEGRINSGMFLGISKGRAIRFFNQRQSVDCEVVGVRKYPSFAAMLRSEGFQKCIPNAHTEQQAINIYDQIPGYQSKAAKSGVLAIEIRVVH